MEIKVCRLNKAEDIKNTEQLAPDMIGVSFNRKGSKFIGSQSAAELFGTTEKNDGIQRVGIFVNAEMDYILNAVHDYKLDWVQLNGNESPGYCQELQLLWSVSSNYKARIIKGFAVDAGFDFNLTNPYVSSCPLFRFKLPPANWEQLSDYAGLTPFLLNTSCNKKNISRIKQLTHPQFKGIDISEIPREFSVLTDFIAEVKA